MLSTTCVFQIDLRKENLAKVMQQAELLLNCGAVRVSVRVLDAKRACGCHEQLNDVCSSCGAQTVSGRQCFHLYHSGELNNSQLNFASYWFGERYRAGRSEDSARLKLGHVGFYRLSISLARTPTLALTHPPQNGLDDAVRRRYLSTPTTPRNSR